MRPNDPAAYFYKIFREHTSGIDPDRKATGQGYQVDEQNSDTAKYTKSKKGCEDGWQYWEPADGQRYGVGSWAQAVPAIKTAENLVYPIANRTLAADTTHYNAKTVQATAGDDHTKYREAQEVEAGTPGLLVACIAHDSNEYIFFPITDSPILVDWTGGTDHSTDIYDSNADGTPNASNIGKTNDVWRVYDNHVYIITAAEFYYSAAKKGSLDFDTAGSYPAVATPSDPTAYAVKCVYSGGKWKWYVEVDAAETVVYYARIRWNYGIEFDHSEGELLNYSDTTDQFTASGTKIWIDWRKSEAVQFWTAGDYTIFEVRKMREDVTRQNKTRNLYAVTRCIRDGGSRITHLKTTQKGSLSRLEGNLLSSDIAGAVWDNPEVSQIKTTIGTQALINKVYGNVPEEWRTGNSAGNYNYVEASDFSRGQAIWFRPIRPVVLDPEALTYESEQKDSSGEMSIATYEKKE